MPKNKPHGDLVDEIIVAVSQAGIARLFKNHTGVARYTSEKTGKKSVVRYGVGPSSGGGHDLIGWRMDGRFISIDAKVGHDRLSDDQIKWMRWVIAGGGISGEARSVGDAINLITEDGRWTAERKSTSHGSMHQTTPRP